MDNIIKVKVDDVTYGIMSGGSKEITLDASNWTFDITSGGYTQTVDVEGINASISCVVDLLVNKVDNLESVLSQWSNIFNAVTANKDDTTGQVIFYAIKPITENLRVLLKW